ncbi:MAG: hypothetical protein QTN59_18235 [Candidatus Electrothrix communis]|nr:MAG: hypothetical protein QTN59_18235 [Candidatus Electrothrix communis]
MKSDLHRHLRGIYSILKSRFDYINHSIGHSLTKGEENEAEIKKLLIEFLPPAYGVGSGLIVDTQGNESKQVDIIIYDKSIPNYTLSSESKIFLVDQVLATIEIKTTFTKTSLLEAIENTNSIKKLHPSQLNWVEPTSKIEDEQHQTWSLTKCKPSPPLSCIFFYTTPQRKTAFNLDDTFNLIKEEIEKLDVSMQPDLLFSLEHSIFFRHDDIAHTRTTSGKLHVCLVNLEENPRSQVTINTDKDTVAIFDFGDNTFRDDSYFEGKNLIDSKNKVRVVALEGDDISLDPLTYKTAKIQDKIYLIDSYRGFINFIYGIDWMLQVKKSNKNGFITDYFPDRFFHLTDYDEGLVKTQS